MLVSYNDVRPSMTDFKSKIWRDSHSHRAYRHRVSALKAIKKSLKGQPLYVDGPGKYTCPVLGPHSDALPFSMSFNFFKPCSNDSSLRSTKRREDLLSLEYILDGHGKLIGADGSQEPVQSGDSILVPHGSMRLQLDQEEDPSAEGSRVSAEWQMTTISLLLPRSDEPAAAQGALGANDSLAAQACARHVTCQDVECVIAGAQARLQTHSQSDGPKIATSLLEAEAASEDKLDNKSHSSSISLMDDRPLDIGSNAEDDSMSSNSNLHHLQFSQSNKAEIAQMKTLKSAFSTVRGVASALQQFSRYRRRLKVAIDRRVLKKRLEDLHSFRLPHQTNRLALVFDPLGDAVNFTMGVEIFEPGHETTPHVHDEAFELFVILAGRGEAFCDEDRFQVTAGDIVVFPPGSSHGIDVGSASKMYCLELMQPNDMFAELVRAGMPAGSLLKDDLCILVPSGCA